MLMPARTRIYDVTLRFVFFFPASLMIAFTMTAMTTVTEDVHPDKSGED